MSRIYSGIKSYWSKPEANEKKDEVSELSVIAFAVSVIQTFCIKMICGVGEGIHT